MNPFKQRRAGVLLHPTSLPSGRLDRAANDWIDWMAQAGFTVWQILPLGVPQKNRSPYMCLSSFAIDPALMGQTQMTAFLESAPLGDFLCWYREHRDWADDYALFRVIKSRHQDRPWYEWPEEYRQRDPDLLAQLWSYACGELNTVILEQYALHTRWKEIRDYAHNKGVYVFGDLPIFVAHDSADVWAHQECFMLDPRGHPTHVAGVPPDYFSASGQRWGNPQYDWNALRDSHFTYWERRLNYHLQIFDLLRIDHFRGLQAVWMIDAATEGAANGYWQEVPGAALLEQLSKDRGKLNLVAEDLGTITDEVEALRRRFALPGMAVLQFAWDGSSHNPHLPENITPDRVAYTGTHDNDTTAGWFAGLEHDVQNRIMHHLDIQHAEALCSAFIDAALGSAAQLAVVPLQDLLGLDSSARMNTPGTDLGNWNWQFRPDTLGPRLAEDLRKRLDNTDRLAVYDE